MTDIRDLQLALWREACRHADAAQSLPALAASICGQVPIEAMWLYGLEGTRCVRTGHWSRMRADAGPRQIEAQEIPRVERFARGMCIEVLDEGPPTRGPLPLLARSLGPGAVVCGGLALDGRPEGLVAWRLTTGDEPGARVLTLLGAALEPLAAALETWRRFHELESLRRSAEAERQSALRRLGRESLSDPIIGAGTGLKLLLERVDIVARSDVPVLILGETGSGKEVVARTIHERSERHDGPFIRVNCGAIPPDLIDSQLFGHERGAFTGATERRQGWFERAHTGTLFLDEVGDLPPAVQVRLLRVIQEGSLERVGGQETVTVDCRIVAATHRDLPHMVQEGTFREDLWYRLAVFPLLLPPLRERKEDLRELAQHFADRAAVRFGLPTVEVTAQDAELLRAYDWPGNVRELAAVIDRAALLGQGRRLTIEPAMGVTPRLRENTPLPPLGRVGADFQTLEEAVRQHIEAALVQSKGRIEGIGGAAELLAENPHTLRSRMRRLGLDWSRFRRPSGPG